MQRLYIIGLVLLPSVASAIDLDESLFVNRQHGIRLEVPEGWTLSQQTGYPSVLALLLHPKSRACINLTLGTSGSGNDLRGFVLKNRKGLDAIGLRVSASRPSTVRGRAVWQLDISDRRGTTALRQLYLVHGSCALILTLSASSAQIKDHLFDLAQVVELLQLTKPEPATLQQTDTVSYPKESMEDDGSTLPGVESRPNRPGDRPGGATQPATRPTSRPAPPEQQEGRSLELEGIEGVHP